jgi:exodeoxyribonuclease-3
VAPTDDDVFDIRKVANDALVQPQTRLAYRAIINLGYTDAFRALHGEPHQYTFWDYQAGAWPRDNGWRIDHLLLSPQAADRLEACVIDRDVRGRPEASDHTPIWCSLNAQH